MTFDWSKVPSILNNNFKKFSIYVVVNFLSLVIFFFFFFGMVTCANEVQHISFCDEFSNQKNPSNSCLFIHCK